MLTFSPSCAAFMAATYPPGPEPITTRSAGSEKAIRINRISSDIFTSHLYNIQRFCTTTLNIYINCK